MTNIVPLRPAKAEPGLTVTVTRDGKVLARCDLAENTALLPSGGVQEVVTALRTALQLVE